MENNQGNRYVKRTQKDNSMSLKLQIVQEIETGWLSISEASRVSVTVSVVIAAVYLHPLSTLRRGNLVVW